MTKKNTKKQIYTPIAFAIVLIVGMWLGSMLVSNNQLSNSFMPMGNNSYNKLSDVLDYIVQDYVDTVDITELETKAIRAMLKELDPHSIYITEAEFNDVNDPLMGSFEGIGISFRIEKDTITVINPIPGGPSEKVGLMAGDRIVKINDTLVAGIGIEKDRKSTRLNSSHTARSRMPSSA